MDVINLFYESVFKITAEALTVSSKLYVRQISVAGITIKCQFAGASLIPIIMPALEHLIVDTRENTALYKIDIWDSESTGIAFPTAPCGIDDILVRGELNGFISERFEASFFTHARMLTIIDHEKKHGVVCFVTSSDIPAFELACPLRGILSWILRRNETAMIHAASVGTPDGSIIIGGNSGAGKSSTALRGLSGGLFYMGDDICAISNKNNTPTVYGIYSSGKTYTSDLKFFPQLASSVHSHFEEDYEKEVYFFYKQFYSQLPKSGHIIAVIIPHQDTSLSISFQKISFAKALSVICSSTKNLLPNPGNEMFHILSAILHQTPCFRFNLGNDPTLIVDSLTNFISSLKKSHE
ncbi:MAG: hypothetical protein ACK4UP_05510 [Spirosomataceae bacterium]